MKTNLRDIDTKHLAFCTGHKLTELHRAFVSPMLGMKYFARLDNGPLQPLTDIRRRLEVEYQAAEARQGAPTR